MLVLVTGATGKVGRHFIERFLADERFSAARVRALCHNRVLEASDRRRSRARLDRRSRASSTRRWTASPTSSISRPARRRPTTSWTSRSRACSGCSRRSAHRRPRKQFILIGGDAAVGHFFYDHDGPVTEATPHRAYPGCYALSKVLEEVMLQQYCIQYGINGCCLRAPWIMEKDDFKYTLSFGDDVFGGPVWKDEVPPEKRRGLPRERHGAAPARRRRTGR